MRPRAALPKYALGEREDEMKLFKKKITEDALRDYLVDWADWARMEGTKDDMRWTKKTQQQIVVILECVEDESSDLFR